MSIEISEARIASLRVLKNILIARSNRYSLIFSVLVYLASSNIGFAQSTSGTQGPFYIQSALSGNRCLDAGGGWFGAYTYMRDCDTNNGNLRWYVHADGGLSTNISPHNCLDANTGMLGKYTYMRGCDPRNTNLRWRLNYIGSGNYQIVSQTLGNRCLDANTGEFGRYTYMRDCDAGQNPNLLWKVDGYKRTTVYSGNFPSLCQNMPASSTTFCHSINKNGITHYPVFFGKSPKLHDACSVENIRLNFTVSYKFIPKGTKLLRSWEKTLANREIGVGSDDRISVDALYIKYVHMTARTPGVNIALTDFEAPGSQRAGLLYKGALAYAEGDKVTGPVTDPNVVYQSIVPWNNGRNQFVSLGLKVQGDTDICRTSFTTHLEN